LNFPAQLPCLLGTALTDTALACAQLTGGGNSAGLDGALLTPAGGGFAGGDYGAVVALLTQWAQALV